MSKQSENQIPMHEPVSIGPMTPEEVRVTRELMETPAIIESLRARIGEVGPMVTHAADAADAEARGELAKQIEAKIMGDAPGRLEAIWRLHDIAIGKIRADHQLSDQGRRERIEVAEAERDEAVQEAYQTADGHAEALVHRASPPRPPAITPEVSAHITTIAATFGPMLPEDFARAALDVLAVAADPTEPPEVREVHTAILAHGYLPLLRRRATAPERFAEPYRDTYGAVVELVQSHIATRAAKHRAATAMREEFRGLWSTLVQTAKSTGKWDSFIANIATGR
jgi:hypothetical protein